MRIAHYITMMLAGINLAMMVRTSAHYLRFAKQKTPGMGYYMVLLGIGTAMSAVVIVSLLLPQGQALMFCVSAIVYSGMAINTSFLLLVHCVAGKSPEKTRRYRIFLVGIAAILFVVYITNGIHHEMIASVNKHADGFLFDLEFGSFYAPVLLYTMLLLAYAIAIVFRKGNKSVLRSVQLRVLLALTTVLISSFSLLEILVPFLADVRISLVLTWIPIVVIGRLFFAYLSTARSMAIEVMKDAYVVFDLHGVCVDINQEGMKFFRRYCGTPKPFIQHLAQLLPENEISKTVNEEIELKVDGKPTYYHVSAFQLSEGTNRYVGNGFTIFEITEYKQKMSKLDSMASEDALTGAKNRRYLANEAPVIFERAAQENTPVSVFMLDIDFFKQINDNYGHRVGDEVLILLQKILVGNLRDSDLVVRYGGEEFLILSEGLPHETAMTVAERVRSLTEQTVFQTAAGYLRITVSIGVYVGIPEGQDAWERFVERADENLYRAKRSGRNRVKGNRTSEVTVDSRMAGDKTE